VHGLVIGVNNSIVDDAQNVGYIIPINEVKLFLKQMDLLIEERQAQACSNASQTSGEEYDWRKDTLLMRKPILGVVYNNGSAALTEYLGNPQPGGLYVVEAVLCHAYDEDVIDGETRIVLRLAPKLAPITAAILPLVKDQNEAAEKLYKTLLQQGFAVTFDPSGSIGKRYRRYDEIGTPLCITYDFDSAGNQTVTIRDRDTTKQERVAISDLPLVITKLLQ
jgi:hypothetical protein